jgi:hypothetical protein
MAAAAVSFLCLSFYFLRMQGGGIAKPGREGYLHWVPFWQFVPHFLTEKGKKLLRKMLFWLAMTALFYGLLFGYFVPRAKREVAQRHSNNSAAPECAVKPRELVGAQFCAPSYRWLAGYRTR